MLVGLRDYPLQPERVAAAERIGYVYRGEFGIPGRQYFRQGSPDAHHVHAVLHGGGLWLRHVAFRDWLREHGEDAARYGELKLRLAVEHRDDRARYTEARRSSSKTCSREPAWAGQGPPLRPVSEWRWSASDDLRWAGQGPPLRAFRGRPAPSMNRAGSGTGARSHYRRRLVRSGPVLPFCLGKGGGASSRGPTMALAMIGAASGFTGASLR